jgi:hypothetical protein
MPKAVLKSGSSRLAKRLAADCMAIALGLVLLTACLAPASAVADDTTIKILTATYGQSCGIAADNAGRALRAACDGKNTCFFRIQNSVRGDPAPGCPKDFSTFYSCSGETRPRQLFVAAEAGSAAIQISCPSSGSGAASSPDAAGAVSTEPPPANTPDAFVRYLYQLVAGHHVHYPDPSTTTRQSFFEDSLNRDFARDLAAGDKGIMRFDPLCQCQDDDGLHILQITTDPPIRGYAQSAIVNVKLGFAGTNQTTVTLAMSRYVLNQWQVSDIYGPLTPSGIISLFRSSFNAEAAKASAEASAALHLSATPSQQPNCNRDDVRDAFLTTFDEILSRPGQPWSYGGPLVAPLGKPGVDLLQMTQGPESSVILSVKAVSIDASSYLSPAEVGPLQFSGPDLLRAGTSIMGVGERKVPAGNYMFCRVDFNLKFTLQRPDRDAQLHLRKYDVPWHLPMLIMIPSDGSGVDKQMRMFGMMEEMLIAINGVNVRLDRQLNH